MARRKQRHQRIYEAGQCAEHPPSFLSEDDWMRMARMLDEATKKPESKRFVQRHHDAGKALWLILQSSNRRAMAYRPVASASFGRAGKALEEMGRSVEEGAPWLVKLQKWLHGEPFHWMDEVQTWDTFTKRLPHYLAIAENPPQQELWGGEGS